jgi:hypothetical protein
MLRTGTQNEGEHNGSTCNTGIEVARDRQGSASPLLRTLHSPLSRERETERADFDFGFTNRRRSAKLRRSTVVQAVVFCIL